MSAKKFNRFIKDYSLTESQEDMEMGYYPKPDDWSSEFERPTSIYGAMDEPEELTLSSLKSMIDDLAAQIRDLNDRIDTL